MLGVGEKGVRVCRDAGSVAEGVRSVSDRPCPRSGGAQGSRSVEDIILCLSAHPPQSLALLVSGSKTLTFTAQLRAPGTLLSLDLSS